MHPRWARFAVVTAVAVTVTAGAAVATAGSAAGSPAPIVIGDCSTTVQGAPGTPVELSPSAVVQPVADLISSILVVGPTLAQPFTSAFTALPPIPIGALPTGEGTITGGQIANAVVAQIKQIPLLGPIISTLTTKVQDKLGELCGVGVTGVNAVVAPVQQGASTVKSASKQVQQQVGLAPKSGSTPGSGGTPGKTGSTGGGTTPVRSGGGSGGTSSSPSGLPSSNSPVLGGVSSGLGAGSPFGAGTLLDYGLAESPLARYAGIPFASAGLFDPAPGVRYGGSVPGYSPSFGVLGKDGTVAQDGVQTAGHAEAYPAGGTLGNGVGLPMLLAVLMLAGVTAALVRTWVLRRTPSL